MGPGGIIKFLDSSKSRTASIVHEHVQPAESGDRPLSQAYTLAGLPQIGHSRVDLVTFLAQRLGCGLEVLGVA
jgi:hypothetical protein